MAGVMELGDALLTDLADALTGESHLSTDLFESALLAANAEALANNLQLTVLKDRELKIVRECFGIGCQERGLEEIGAEMGLTRERVRQIREKSITKLHDSGHARILMKYLG